MPDDKNDDGQKPGSWNTLAEAWMLAFLFPAAIAGGVLLGWGAEKLFAPSPWGKIVGAALGAAAGFLNLFRVGTRSGGDGGG